MNDDLISRQDAINTLWKIRQEEILDGRRLHDYCSLSTAVDMIKDLPSVQPKPQWIPVSERLPEKPNVYTVTDSKGDVVRFVFYDNESSRKYWLKCAKAWIPLPEPYKEKKIK